MSRRKASVATQMAMQELERMLLEEKESEMKEKEKKRQRKISVGTQRIYKFIDTYLDMEVSGTNDLKNGVDVQSLLEQVEKYEGELSESLAQRKLALHKIDEEPATSSSGNDGQQKRPCVTRRPTSTLIQVKPTVAMETSNAIPIIMLLLSTEAEYSTNFYEKICSSADLKAALGNLQQDEMNLIKKML